MSSCVERTSINQSRQKAHPVLSSGSGQAIEQAVGSRDDPNAQYTRSRKAQARSRGIGTTLGWGTVRSRQGSSRATPQGLGRQPEPYRETCQTLAQQTVPIPTLPVP